MGNCISSRHRDRRRRVWNRVPRTDDDANVHSQLLVDVADDMLEKEERRFRVRVAAFQEIGERELERCQGVTDVLQLMERKNIISKGNYGNLKKILKDLYLEKVLRIVEEAETRIQNARMERKGNHLQDLQHELKSFYIAELSVLPNSPWESDSAQLPMENVYTNLSWDQEKEGSGSFIHYRELLKGHRKRFLILGEAGIGKSTFTNKISLDWASGTEETLNQFEVVLKISLRSVTKNQSLIDVIYDQLLPSTTKVPRDFLESIIEHSEKALLILDGYDEYEPETSKEITEIIDWKAYRDLHVLLTSRPGRGEANKSKCGNCARILGFSEENIREYTAKVLPKETNEFISYLKKKGLYDNLARVPFILHILHLVYKESVSGQTAASEQYDGGIFAIYKDLHVVLLKRYSNSKHGELCRKKQGQLCRPGQVFEHYKPFLKDLGKHAFAKLLHNVLFFEEDHIDCNLLHTSVEVGLMCQQKVTRKTCPIPQWSFQHKSLQEFVSAVYIVQTAEDGDEGPLRNLLEHCQTLAQILDMYLLLVFCLGLCSTGVVLGPVLHKIVECINHEWTTKLGALPGNIFQRVTNAKGYQAVESSHIDLTHLSQVHQPEILGHQTGIRSSALRHPWLRSVPMSAVQTMFVRSVLTGVDGSSGTHLPAESAELKQLAASLSRISQLKYSLKDECMSASVTQQLVQQSSGPPPDQRNQNGGNRKVIQDSLGATWRKLVERFKKLGALGETTSPNKRDNYRACVR